MDHLTITSYPDTSTLIPMADIRQHCQLDGTSEDNYLYHLIDVAYHFVCQEADISILETDYTLTTDCIPKFGLRLPRQPISEITSITYYSTDNTLQTLTEYYRVGHLIVPHTPLYHYSRPDAITVTYTGQMGTVMPQAIHAIKLIVSTLFENREDEVSDKILTKVQLGVDRLIAQLRQPRYV